MSEEHERERTISDLGGLVALVGALAGLVEAEPVLDEVVSRVALRLGERNYLQSQLQELLGWEEEREPTPTELVARVRWQIDGDAAETEQWRDVVHTIDNLLTEAGVAQMRGDNAARVRWLVNAHNTLRSQLIMVPHGNVRETEEGPVGKGIAFFRTQEFVEAVVALVEIIQGLDTEWDAEAQKRVDTKLMELGRAVGLDRPFGRRSETSERVRQVLQYLATRKEPLVEGKFVFETRTHHVKCWPLYFQAIDAGKKSFDVRKNDRNYRPEDILHLREWEPRLDGSGAYTGNDCYRRITCVLEKFEGLKPGYVVLGLEACEGPPLTGETDENQPTDR